MTTTRAKPLTRPAGRNTLATRSVFSSAAKPVNSPVTAPWDCAVFRINVSSVRGSGKNALFSQSRSRAYRLGASRWPTRGTAESNPSTEVDSHPRNRLLEETSEFRMSSPSIRLRQRRLSSMRAVFGLGLFQDGVVGFHHYWTKRGAVRIVDSLIVHCNAEVPGRTEGLHQRVNFFEGAPHGFLALINAEEHLRGRSAVLVACAIGQAAVLAMARQSSQDLAFVPALIGQVEDAAAFQSVECFYFAHEGRPFRIREPGHFVSGEPDHACRIINARRTAQSPFLLGLERVLLGRSLGTLPFVTPLVTWSAAPPGSPSTNRAEFDVEPGWDLPRSRRIRPAQPGNASNSD